MAVKAVGCPIPAPPLLRRGFSCELTEPQGEGILQGGEGGWMSHSWDVPFLGCPIPTVHSCYSCASSDGGLQNQPFFTVLASEWIKSVATSRYSLCTFHFPKECTISCRN